MPAKSRKKEELKAKAAAVAKGLARTYPDAECALAHKNPYELLTATILSAQCTDERVNAVTPTLFARYPSPAKLAAGKQEEVEKIIHSLGFFRAKATNLLGMARKVVADFDGEIPRTLDELVSLPGVGRKTANVLMGTAFREPTGVVVDTHVTRISRLLGLTRNLPAEKIEQDLMELLPSSEWIDFSHRLIHHGRRICIARRPKCTECPLLPNCDRVGLPPLTNGKSPTATRVKKSKPRRAAAKRSAAPKRPK
jgi:endonuclease-3